MAKIDNEVVNPEPTRFLVKTPQNPAYSGKTLGVHFSNGQAVVEELTIDKRIGKTIAEIVWLFEKDFGYEVSPVV